MKKNDKKKTSNLRILLVCISVIMVWRGVWDLCDMFIFPSNKVLSDITCLIIGLIILLVDDGKIDELK